jgi:hypothetical protein
MRYSDRARFLPMFMAGALALSTPYEGKTQSAEIEASLKRCPAVSSLEAEKTHQIIYQRPLNNQEELEKILVTPWDELKAYRARQAEKHNLTLIDSDPYTRRIAETNTVDEVIHVMDEFGSHYNFRTSVMEEVDDIAKSESPYIKAINKHDINSDRGQLMRFRNGANNFFYALSAIPVEFIKASGVKEVKVIDLTPQIDSSGNKRYFGGGYSPDSKRIYFYKEALHTQGRRTVPHEFFHGFDHEQCGIEDMVFDRGFDALNPPGFQYGVRNEKAVGTIVARAKGLEEIAEDKATIAELILEHNQFRAKSPVIQNKIDFLLARMEKVVPGITVLLYSNQYENMKLEDIKAK